jgi:4-carboxymuconolactone decarboxylase
MISRIPLLRQEQLSRVGRNIYSSILRTRGNLDGPFLAWLHSPGLAGPAVKLGTFCRYDTGLTEVESELLILLVAAHFRCSGEWQIHAPIAVAAGLEQASIDAIMAGQVPILPVGRLSLLHMFGTELLRRNEVSQTTFEEATELFGYQRLVEIVGLIGYYCFVAMTLNAFDIRLADRGAPFASTTKTERAV